MASRQGEIVSLPRNTRNRLRTAALVGLSAALLAGCGSARPGVAIEVDGDQVASLSRVDQASLALCEALRPELEQSQQSWPNSQVRTLTAYLLVTQEVAERIGEEEGLKPSAEYGQAVAYFENQAKNIDEDLRDDFVQLNSIGVLEADYRTQLGTKALEEMGVEVTPEAAAAAGSQIFAAWMADHDIEVDPRFGVVVADGAFTTRNGSLGVAVSDLATTRSSTEDLSYAASMPEGQVCR